MNMKVYNIDLSKTHPTVNNLLLRYHYYYHILIMCEVSLKGGKKSHFIICCFTLKVNGTDLSDASHDDTVKAFYSAEEPILVEVVRRGYKTDDSKQNHQKDNLTQSKSHNSLVQPSSNQQTSTLNRSSSSLAVEELSAACTKRCSCMEKTMKSQGTQTDCFIDSTELFQNFFRAPSPPPLTR